MRIDQRRVQSLGAAQILVTVLVAYEMRINYSGLEKRRLTLVTMNDFHSRALLRFDTDCDKQCMADKNN